MRIKYWMKYFFKKPFYFKLKNSYQNLPARQKNVIFVHVPKVAGTSVHQSLFGRQAGFGHATAGRYLTIYGPLEFAVAFKFAFVRNPYDRFVSTYEYLKQGGNNSNDLIFYEKYMKNYTDFDDFVLNGFCKRPEIRSYIHFKKQVDFIYIDGKNALDFVGRFENLETDYKYIASIVGVERELIFSNKTNQRQEFNEYLMLEDTKKVISNYYYLDFIKFDYKI